MNPISMTLRKGDICHMKTGTSDTYPKYRQGVYLVHKTKAASAMWRITGRRTMVHIENLVKRYGDLLALDHLNLDIKEGEVFGLLGSSGAGKTTLIKVILGLADYCEGKVSVFGKNPREYDGSVYSSFGCVLDGDGLYERLSCFDNLEVFADVYSIENKREMILNLLDRVGLSDVRKRKVSDLSKGMRQRLSFARAILHNPKIVILDEPTSGLDPATTLRIHSLVKELQNRGTSFLFHDSQYERSAENVRQAGAYT